MYWAWCLFKETRPKGIPKKKERVCGEAEQKLMRRIIQHVFIKCLAVDNKYSIYQVIIINAIINNDDDDLFEWEFWR